MPGWRQIADRERSRSPPRRGILDVQKSETAVSHLKDWCLGRLSGPELGRHALAYVAEHGKNRKSAIMGALNEIAWNKSNIGLLKRMQNMRFTKLIERVP